MSARKLASKLKKQQQDAQRVQRALKVLTSAPNSKEGESAFREVMEFLNTPSGEVKKKAEPPKSREEKPAKSPRQWQALKRIVLVEDRSDNEAVSLMSPGQTVTDYFQLKLVMMVRKCDDIPPEMRSKVVETVLKDEMLKDSGKGLKRIIGIAALRLGLGRIVEDDAPRPEKKMAVKPEGSEDEECRKGISYDEARPRKLAKGRFDQVWDYSSRVA